MAISWRLIKRLKEAWICFTVVSAKDAGMQENGIKSLRKHRAAAATFLNDHKVGLTLLVDLANAAKQKAHTGVLQKEKEVREV